MKLSINQATLMKTPMEIFLKAISKAGFKGVELRRDETFKYLENHAVEDLKRNLDESQVRKLADGMFYLGTEAKEFGLVDQLGNKEDAIKYIEEKQNIKARIIEYKGKISFLSSLSRMQAQNSYWLGRGIGTSLIETSFFNSLNIVV